MKKISINSEELAYTDEGKGAKTLIFVHGLSSNLEAWKKNISGLSGFFRCVALDLPGYGKSSKNKTSYSLVEYADFLLKFAKEKQLENPVLVGHSMGGQIAVHAVLQSPGYFEKLILVAPAGIETFTEEEARIMKFSYTPEMVKNATDAQIRSNFLVNFYEFPEDAAFMIEDRIAMKSATDFGVYSEIIVNNIGAMLEEPVFDSLDKISIPVLIIYGKNDQLIPNKYFHPTQDIEFLVKGAKTKIPTLKVELINEAGHFVNFEKASEVNQKIECFINN
ncbi:MAG: alpha/beta hydrolase [Gillisia sp.]